MSSSNSEISSETIKTEDVVDVSKEKSKKITKKSRLNYIKKNLKKHWPLYLFLVPVIIYFLVFHYVPMYGVQIAFKDFFANLGITGSPWVGFKHFERFFNSYYFGRLLTNTLALSLYGLLLFPLPVIFALMINEVRDGRFKRWSQTITYAPYFISVVVVVGMLVAFLDPSTGIVNHFIQRFGGDPIPFLTSPDWFRHIYTWSGQWQSLGWNTIIYLAALSGVNPELHEAAKVDGATRFQRIIHINIPSILPTIITLFILTLGSFMSTGFEKVLLMQNSLNAPTSDIIQTFVYEIGLMGGEYSFAAAIGLFESIINVVLIVLANYTSRKVSENSLW
jgi:putative aldouronate transport system permease protein